VEHKLNCDETTDRALIEGYVTGRLGEADTEAFESHYLTCERCQNELRLALAIRETLPEVWEAGLHVPAKPEVSVISRHFKGRTAAALAAAAVLAGLLLVRPSKLDEESPPVHRDEATGVEVAPSLRAPAGVVAVVGSFEWTQVPAADLYRITVCDAEGAVVWEAETRDASITPPDGTGFEPDTRYAWTVAASVDFDRWVSSEFIDFTILEP
jgi:hypothetical protein